MIRLKTDKVDAKTIARYGIEQNPTAYKPLTEPQKEIKSLRTVLSNLIKQRTMTKNLLHSQKLLSTSNKESIKAIKNILRTLDKQIKTLEVQIENLIKDHFNETYKNILSIKGIGPKSAIGIIAYLGDLSNFDSYKQIASYIGITPAIKESGKSIKKTVGITKQGNSTLRTLFYLAALSASKYNQGCKLLYDRLLANGKRKKTALIAVANKLVKQLFAIVKFNRTFINNYNFKLVS
jgi:transposase